jgi:bla regulator protein BlaR1
MNASLLAGSPWIDALGWTLLHFIWQGLVIGAGFAIARAWLPKERCDARYAAGLVALAVTAICPALTFSALLHRQTIGAALAPAVPGAQGQIAAAIASVQTAVPVGTDGWLPWLVLVWVGGVLFMACRALHQWRVLARVARHHALRSVEWESVLATLARRFRFARRIRVLVSECIDTPTLIGWLKPVILLPAAVALGFPRQQIELILAHELGHLRRYDHLINLAQALLETLLFYHPVVHWISGEIRNEREICCDALVLRVTAGEPREYARTLAALEELRQRPSAQLALAASGGVLLDRVRRIVGMPATGLTAVRPNAGLWVLIAAGLTIAITSALRIGHGDDIQIAMRGLAVDWLPTTQLPALSMLALSVPRQRPHLELAAVVSQATTSVVPPIERVTPTIARAGSVSERIGASGPVVTSPVALAGPAPAVSVDPVLQSPANALPGTPVKIPSGPIRTATIAHAAAPVRPTATHIVAPAYPALAHGDRTERIETSFAIGTDGNVRDIAITNGGFDARFARAAEQALQQWRFESSTVPTDRSVRYTQIFVFAPWAQRDAAVGGGQECIQRTGSHICRRVDEPHKSP